MTLSPFLVYLTMQANRFSVVAVIVAIVFIIIACASMVASDSYLFKSDEAKAHRKRAKQSLLAAIICGLLFVFMPSTKTIAAMVILPPVVNSEQVQQLPADILGFVRGLIREYTPQKETDL